MRKHCFLYHLQMKESLCKVLCLDWPLINHSIARFLPRFELSAQTANKAVLTLYEDKNDSFRGKKSNILYHVSFHLNITSTNSQIRL